MIHTTISTEVGVTSYLPPLINRHATTPNVFLELGKRSIGYHKEKLETELKQTYPQILAKIRIQITPKPTKDKLDPGFKPVYKRWIIERTNSWSEKCRVLWKNCEKLIETSVAKLQLCTIRLQIKRLAKG